MNNIFVYIENEGGKAAEVCLELMTKGRELATTLGVKLEAVVLGENLAGIEHELAKYGADTVWIADDKVFAPFRTLPHTAVMCGLIEQEKPQIVLFGATCNGRDFAPRVSSALYSGLTADCTQLVIGDHKDAKSGREYKDLLYQIRPAFGGNLMATIICPNHRPQMATVRPGIFKAPEFDYSRSGTITQVVLADDVKARVEISIPAEEWGQQASIADAERLVVVGRGIGSKKNLPLMRKLADALGAELGCTRPIVEAGWLEYRHQIGQTGVSVSPKLLVSIGVSGAIQHLAGIGGAECIVAINEDPDAPIFGAAQYKVVGDAVEIVEELLAQLEC